MIRVVPWLLFGLSLFAGIYLFFLLLDAGVALDDARSQVARLRERNELMLSVARKDWIGRPAASVSDLGSEFMRPGLITKKTEDGALEIGDLVFEIKNGVVTHIRYLD